MTSVQYVEEALRKLTGQNFQDFRIAAIFLMGGTEEEVQSLSHLGMPVYILNHQALEWASHEYVAGFFVLQPEETAFPKDLMNIIMKMGITMYYTNTALDDDNLPSPDIQKLGSYRVIASSPKFVSVGWLILKRLMDIIGGLIGCVFTLLLMIIIGPMIYIKSPGPIIFKQRRIGRNGRPFTLYKFRSMYMDAEERKAALMEQNKMQGLMFKMDDDPRIIGSEKKDKNGRPKGIGNFIRRTSIDEFPQFFNCLLGSMSLVGWRPCTQKEWEQYDLEHRSRAGMKPGITGMWQVSGRSEITDFNEVVRLDQEYIENWSLRLDIKILLKTVWVVLRGKGAE